MQNSLLLVSLPRKTLHKKLPRRHLVCVSTALEHTGVQVPSNAIRKANLVIIHTFLISSCLTIFHVFLFWQTCCIHLSVSTEAYQDSVIRSETNDFFKNLSAIEFHGHAPLSLFYYETNQTRAANLVCNKQSMT